MQRAFLAMVAIVASLAVGAGSQTPAPQPAQPAETPPATSASTNVAPAISLSTQPARQVFSIGERFTVVAAASDNTDSPERLQYRWTVKNLESGVEQAARDTALRQVRTSRGAAGNYEYKCIVTDSGGASAEATLVVSIEDTGNPEVVGLAFDDSTGALHRVTPYWRAGFPAVRRGEWAVMLVSVRNFVAGPHALKVFVDGKPVAAGDAGAAWALQNLGGTTTERRVRLFVPPDAGVGKHTIEVAAFRRDSESGAESETSRFAFSPEPLVLFNPWRSTIADVSVYAEKPLSSNHATFYTRGTQDLVMTGLASKSVYDVTPHEKSVAALAQEIVGSMPQEARADAGSVASAMAAYVGDKVLPGKAIKKPWEWRASSEVFDEYLKAKQKVSYGQSSVFGFTLTSLLRSIGIPARQVTVIGSGRDVEPEWAVLQTKYDCKRWMGVRCEEPQTASSQEQLSFHTWNEVWVNGDWAAVDATPQPRAGGGNRHVGTTSLKAVREFPTPQRGQQLPDADDAAFLYAATKLPWEISWKAQDGNWYQATGRTATATHGFVSDSALNRSDVLQNYGVIQGLGGPSAKEPAIQIIAEPVVNLRTNTKVRIVASGLRAEELRQDLAGGKPSRLGFALLHLPRELSGGTLEEPLAGGLAYATLLDVRPSLETWTATVDIPADVLSVAGAYEVAVGPQQGTAGPSGRARFDVRGLPIAVALPERVNAGATFAVSSRLVNSTSAPVRDATLRLVLPNQLRVVSTSVGGKNSNTQALIPPAGDMRVDAIVQAISSGIFLAGAASESSAGPSEEHAQVVVSQEGRLFVAGEPALAVTPGEILTVKANVLLEAIEPANDVEARLELMDGAPITILNDARKLNATLEPDDAWTPSWQVMVTAPGTYRLPVRVKTTGLGEAGGEIVVVAGASDPDADTTDDFDDEASLGYRSPKAVAGAVAAGLGLLGAAAYLIRRRIRRL